MSDKAIINKPIVSIVVPIYNMEDTLAQSVTSLTHQNYTNIEIILVDDGSTDQSLNVCKELARNDSRIKFVHTSNQGSGRARNKGIELSSGRYIYFPDADDILSPSAITTMVEEITNEPDCDLLVFGFKSIRENGVVVSEKKYDPRIALGIELRQSYSECMGINTRWGIQGAPWNKFFDLDVIKKHNIEFPDLRRHQDEGFIGRYMCYVEKVKFITDVLYTYKVNDIKKTWSKYPLNYIDAVIGLNEVRKATICTWNNNDIKTKYLLQREFICNIIKSLELVFSPKMKGGFRERLNYIKNGISKSHIMEVPVPPNLGCYQRIALVLMKHSMLLTLYLFYIKTRAEKWGIL